LPSTNEEIIACDMFWIAAELYLSLEWLESAFTLLRKIFL
jgi:hypothetical protein